MDDISPTGVVLLLILAVFVLFGGIGSCMVVMPAYNVYYERKEGEAELARAESNRDIAVLEAKAKFESSKSLADAEVVRAEGVARANKIIGDSLNGNESYLRYLWIQGLQTNQMQVVYIPTEANLPLLEATRMQGIK